MLVGKEPLYSALDFQPACLSFAWMQGQSSPLELTTGLRTRIGRRQPHARGCSRVLLDTQVHVRLQYLHAGQSRSVWPPLQHFDARPRHGQRTRANCGVQRCSVPRLTPVESTCFEFDPGQARTSPSLIPRHPTSRGRSSRRSAGVPFAKGARQGYPCRPAPFLSPPESACHAKSRSLETLTTPVFILRGIVSGGLCCSSECSLQFRLDIRGKEGGSGGGARFGRPGTPSPSTEQLPLDPGVMGSLSSLTEHRKPPSFISEARDRLPRSLIPALGAISRPVPAVKVSRGPWRVALASISPTVPRDTAAYGALFASGG